MKFITEFKEAKPFDRPKTFGKGADSRDTIHLWVGRCLSTWEWETEGGFARIFSVLVAKPSSHAAARAYGLMNSVTVRKQLVSGAAESFFGATKDTNLHDELRKMLKLFEVAGQRRNDIAHGVAQEHNTKTTSGSYLGPSMMTSKSRRMNYDSDYIYSPEILEDFNAKFDLLGRKAHMMADTLGSARSVQEYLRNKSREKRREQRLRQQDDR